MSHPLVCQCSIAKERHVMLRYSVAAATTACVALIAGVWYTSLGPVSTDQFASCRTSSIAGGTSQIGGAFTLIDSNGQTVTSAEVLTQPSLIYFGYTFCPDICPLDALRNVDAVDLLESQGRLVTPVFISIDPRRDTPEVIGEFAENMHERMIGLTGTPEQVKAASKTYKTYFKAHAAEDEYYLVDHSTFSYLVLPEHGFTEFFRRDLSAEAVADRISCFVDNA
jgi:protein SCO1/2